MGVAWLRWMVLQHLCSCVRTGTKQVLSYSTKPPLDTTVFSIRDATSTIQVQSVKFECISLVEVASPPKNDKFRLSTNYLQKNKMSQTQINDLPGEVLVQIFQLLSPKDLKSAMLVCKSWVMMERRPPACGLGSTW